LYCSAVKLVGLPFGASKFTSPPSSNLISSFDSSKVVLVPSASFIWLGSITMYDLPLPSNLLLYANPILSLYFLIRKFLIFLLSSL
jgi:hypothetical protein